MNTSNKSYAGLDIIATENRIAKCIKESGIGDKELGEMMHISIQAVNKWRHGRSIPEVENLYLLSRILGKRVDDLLIPKTTRREGS